MTTNREWLYSLDVADLSDWFDAEHVDAQSKAQSKMEPNLTEQSASLSDLYGILSDANDDFAVENDISATNVDANDENATCNNSGDFVTDDSREKLEADVREYYRIGLPGIQETELHRLYYEQVIEWLDRQADIIRKTEQAAWIQQANGLIHEANVRAEELRGSLDTAKQLIEQYKADGVDNLRKIDELREELAKRDKGIERLKRQRDTARAKIDELHAECDTCCYKTDYIEMDFLDVDRLEAERDALAADLKDCEQQRERLRQALGTAIDHAHEVVSLVNLDGEVIG